MRLVFARLHATHILLLAFAALLAVPATGEARSNKLQLGITGTQFSDPVPRPDDPWLKRTVDVGAQLVLLGASWHSIAPDQPPPAFRPTDPADPAYSFAPLDAQVRVLAERDRKIGLTVTHAPAWSTAAGASSDADRASWRPDPTQFGHFARALAARYDGTFPDPLQPGHALPRVYAFQAWTEPNLTSHLAPQWTGSGRRVRPAAPAHYRRMLNAFYAGVKAVNRRALVVTAGTAPFGDPVAGGQRMAPALFWRQVFCLRGRKLRRLRCPEPARFDVVAHHPYSVGSPSRRALNPDDISIPDLHKLTRPLRAAERSGRVLPRKRHRLWVTEFSWDTRPQDPDGVPSRRHARWIGQAFESFWRQGVDTVAWFRLGDQPGPPFNTTYQSGLYSHTGKVKPAARAFRFPISVRKSGSRVSVWTRLPESGVLRIQRRIGTSWRTIASRRGRAGAVRVVEVRAPRGARIRGRMGDITSIAWRI